MERSSGEDGGDQGDSLNRMGRGGRPGQEIVGMADQLYHRSSHLTFAIARLKGWIRKLHAFSKEDCEVFFRCIE